MVKMNKYELSIGCFAMFGGFGITILSYFPVGYFSYPNPLGLVLGLVGVLIGISLFSAGCQTFFKSFEKVQKKIK
jgi:hypothetical protein